MPPLIFANTICRLRTAVDRSRRVMGSGGGKGVQTESRRREKYEVSVSVGGKWTFTSRKRGAS